MAGPSNSRINLGYMIAVFVLLMLFQLWLGAQSVMSLSYSAFLGQVEIGNVSEITVTNTRVDGTFVDPVEGHSAFVTQRVDPDFAERMAAAGVEISGGSDENWLTVLLSWIVPVAFFFALWAFFIRRMAQNQGMGGLVNIGKSKAKIYLERDTGVTFEDVAGVDEAQAELQEIVSFLADRDKYSRLGARIPKGILLVGPPGTGKTLLARAIAGEAQVPFFSISGSEFVEMFVGVGAARVRDLFDQAREAAPCIIFIDELDALGRARSAIGGFGGHDEKEQTLNQLLSELDGFDPSVGIVLLAATNRPEILDPALLRSGRFDRQVVVDRPERKGRVEILRVHSRKVTLAHNVRLEDIAGITAGFTGADLANLINEAAILATRRGGQAVTMDDLTAAVERIVAGAERKTRILSDDERRRVAYHEMGHALAAVTMPGADPVHKVSIIPRAIGALGYTLQRPTEDRFLITFKDLQERMVVLLAGRASEEIVFGDVSTGAADDLVKVTDIARECVTRYGMSETVGQAVLEQRRLQWLGDNAMAGGAKDFSEATSREVDLAVRDMIDVAYARAKVILTERRKDLDTGAALLLERETITPDDFPPLKRQPKPNGPEGKPPLSVVKDNREG